MIMMLVETLAADVGAGLPDQLGEIALADAEDVGRFLRREALDGHQEKGWRGSGEIPRRLRGPSPPTRTPEHPRGR